VYAVLAGKLSGRNAGIVFFEDANDLSFRESTLAHRKRLLAGLLGSAANIFRWRDLTVSCHYSTSTVIAMIAAINTPSATIPWDVIRVLLAAG
jgi:hypothetical protein